MSRRVYLLGVGLALVALALAFTDWTLSLQPGVTEANVKRIREGMRLAEVEALLGGPAHGEHPTPPICGIRDQTKWPSRHVSWRGPEGNAEVHLNPFGAVVHAYFGRMARPGPLARLRAWLGW